MSSEAGCDPLASCGNREASKPSKLMDLSEDDELDDLSVEVLVVEVSESVEVYELLESVEEERSAVGGIPDTFIGSFFGLTRRLRCCMSKGESCGGKCFRSSLWIMLATE